MWLKTHFNQDNISKELNYDKNNYPPKQLLYSYCILNYIINKAGYKKNGIRKTESHCTTMCGFSEALIVQCIPIPLFSFLLHFFDKGNMARMIKNYTCDTEQPASPRNCCSSNLSAYARQENIYPNINTNLADSSEHKTSINHVSASI